RSRESYRQGGAAAHSGNSGAAYRSGMDAESAGRRRGEEDVLVNVRIRLSLLPANLSHALRRSGMAQHRPPDDDRRRIAADQRSRTRPAEPRPCRPSHQPGTGEPSEVPRTDARPTLDAAPQT